MENSEKLQLFYQKTLQRMIKNKNIHIDSSSYYSKLNYYIIIPSVLITGLSGIGSFLSSTELISENVRTDCAIAVGVLSCISTLLQSISGSCQYDTKSEMHRSAAEEYEILITKLKFEMEQPNEEDFLNNLEDKIIQIQTKCKFFPPYNIVLKYEK